MTTTPHLFSGDEAIAQGALDAGLSGAYAYPGTPSTEVLEYIQRVADPSIHSQWSANEKTAMEEALGMSYAGKRTLVSMKHVGLNVAADAFVNSAITGSNGGLLVIAADDPSMHSSQNEQDSRFYAKFAGLPLFEPSTQQEAYEMMFDAYALSEELKLPVVIRITTRLAHSRGNVIRKATLPQNEIKYPEDDKKFILLPANARRNYAELIEKQEILREKSENSAYNTLSMRENSELGIVACGLTINYLAELFGSREAIPYSLLSIRQYPAPQAQIRQIFEQCETVLIIEEGAPMLEELARGILPLPYQIKGRLDHTLPRVGELSPDSVAQALGLPESTVRIASTEVVRPRPPQLCQGCPHIDSYNFLNAVVDQFPMARVFADIGCYTLGALPPYEAIHTTVDMGASITMAKGAADAGVYPSIAVIGDSTFAHSGITGLLDAAHENTNMTVIILDNDTTAMTGQQTSMTCNGVLERLVEGTGVPAEHIRIIRPLPKTHEENRAILLEEVNHPGISVIISRRPCVQIKRTV